ncbi:hypothetical protein ANI_1_3126024 [Paecilomyces variotii No. 5]|uniref:Uncharacterized protein n=1 Tax=Byssochlamys spectabilis (strain No. 5 / NBRC 109023) TaxID=1356009 RepID=V5G465_BYSSN|nr:hypothetical protein ANI_1_3126024 [Paecilomyces variotii No. 5]
MCCCFWFEALLECLGFHRTARSLRLWQLGFYDPRAGDAAKYKPEIQWIKGYERKERNEIALLQRIHRLEREQPQFMATGMIPTIVTLPPRAIGKKRPGVSKYSVTKYSGALEKELKIVRELCDRVQKSLARMYSDQPRKGRGLRLREWQKIREPRANEMPMLWMDGRKACALAGGCCGRMCRCCDSPLRTYFEPSDDPYELRKVVGIYGHCTNECGCCARHNGHYRPDFHLEELISEIFRRADVENDVWDEPDGSDDTSSAQTLFEQHTFDKANE